MVRFGRSESLTEAGRRRISASEAQDHRKKKVVVQKQTGVKKLKERRTGLGEELVSSEPAETNPCSHGLWLNCGPTEQGSKVVTGGII